MSRWCMASRRSASSRIRSSSRAYRSNSSSFSRAMRSIFGVWKTNEKRRLTIHTVMITTSPFRNRRYMRRRSGSRTSSYVSVSGLNLYSFPGIRQYPPLKISCRIFAVYLADRIYKIRRFCVILQPRFHRICGASASRRTTWKNNVTDNRNSISTRLWNRTG